MKKTTTVRYLAIIMDYTCGTRRPKGPWDKPWSFASEVDARNAVPEARAIIPMPDNYTHEPLEWCKRCKDYFTAAHIH